MLGDEAQSRPQGAGREGLRPTSPELPHWEPGSAGVLSVSGPHSIPISTAVRVADDRLVFALGSRREALKRLRSDPAATFCLLAEALAFTAHGTARVLREELDSAPVVAVELRVERVQDHLADGRTEMLSAPGWRWLDERAAASDPDVRAELERLRSGS